MTNGDDGGDYRGYVDVSAKLLPDPSPELEKLLRKREAELEAKRRARALWRQEMADFAWVAVLWLSVNGVVYMLTGFMYAMEPNVVMPNGAALFWRPTWFVFQVLMNIVIIAGIRLGK